MVLKAQKGGSDCFHNLLKYEVSTDGKLYRWSANKIIFSSIHGESIRLVTEEAHKGVERNHSGGRPLTLKIKSQ